jgi:hypothetical protein
MALRMTATLAGVSSAEEDGGRPRVAMMQSGQDLCGDDGPSSLDGASSRRVLAQPQVRATPDELELSQDQKRDTQKGPWRQQAGMALPSPNSAHGNQLISAKPRGTAGVLTDLHM